jgi:thymidylate synthase ThyX
MVFPLAFGADLGERALAAGFGERYETILREAGERVQAFGERPDVAAYLLPLAYRQRALFKMDDAEAAYIVELRSAPAGHFSYRSVAYQMWVRLREQVPSVAALARVTNPHETVELLTR